MLRNSSLSTKFLVGVLVFSITFLLSWLIAGIVVTLLKNSFSFEFLKFIQSLTDPVSIIIPILASIIGTGFYLYLIFFSSKAKDPSYKRSKSNLYDDSRFLTREEINKYYGVTIGKNKYTPIFYPDVTNQNVSGLIINSGFTKENLYYFNVASGVHNLIVGTTGTGKTKYLLTPSILMMAKSKNKPSMVIIDVKGEILSKTYNTFTTTGYEPHVLDLRNPLASEKYNPLEVIINYFDKYLEDKTKNINFKYMYEAEINKVTELIIPEEKGSDAFWSSAAQGVFKGILYGLLEDYEENLKLKKEKGFKKSQFTFATIHNINSLTGEEFREFFLRRPNSSEARKIVSANVLSNYEPTGQMNRTLSSIMSTYVTGFNRFIDSASIDITLRSDFSASKIQEKPMVIYILLPDEDTSKYPLASVIINQIYSLCVTSSQGKELKDIKRDIHFLLDEFPNLPKFPKIDNWLSIGRERRIFISIFIQALSQLEDKYGKELTKTILQNCNMKIVLGLGETQAIDYFKHLFGTYTVDTTSSTASYREHGDSSSSSLQKADLVNATDLMNMKRGEIYFIELKHYPGHTNIQPIFDERFKINVLIEEYTLEDRLSVDPIKREDYIYNPYDATVVDDMIETAKETLSVDPLTGVVDPVKETPTTTTKDDGIDLDSDDDIGF